MQCILCGFGLTLILLVTRSPGQEGGANDAEVLEKENTVEAQLRGTAWKNADVGLKMLIKDRLRTGELSRAALRLADRSVLRVDELTTLQISTPARGQGDKSLRLDRGAAYFFSRERGTEIEVRTPAANGALRGTAFVVRVYGDGRTVMALLEGELEMSNPQGRVLLRAGEMGEAVPGGPPRKTAMIEAKNVIQWCLYYPGVVHLPDLAFDPRDRTALRESMSAYASGDLLGAVEQFPLGYTPSSSGGLVFRAMITLAVGQVEKGRTLLREIPDGPNKDALLELIDAVNFNERDTSKEPQNVGGWLARSYYEQSRSRLNAALNAARRALALAPDDGYVATRVAELEFSFGRVPRALRELERGFAKAPRNAQAFALRGFLLSAENRIEEATHSFNEAIRLDGALGNAWLGRGLCAIRRGREEEGRRDLQTAAVMEPNRSIFHSYLGKAFSQIGDERTAFKDFEFAKVLDSRDPTPWLYSAVQAKQMNRYNAAIADLERSLELVDNRRVYRSSFLLDQDRSIRGTNLASIYLGNGMVDQSVREAIRAVDSDYSSAPAHLFLANSYNALRDPNRVILRYETAWFNELLLANLLSPVGGGPLSQYVSQQEYAKLFESDGLGFSSTTDWFGYGELRGTASQFGTFGNISYALDAEYQYNDGLRPNNEISRFEGYAQFKLQLGPQDTVFFQTKFQDLQTGDVLQRYDPGEVSEETARLVRTRDGRFVNGPREPDRVALSRDFRELQDPALILLAWHHEWQPGIHTLLLAGRLANDQVFLVDSTPQAIVSRNVADTFPREIVVDEFDPSAPLRNGDVRRSLLDRAGQGEITRIAVAPFDLDYRANFETYTLELSQIVTMGSHSVVAGGRYQRGTFDTHVRLTNFDNGRQPEAEARLFQKVPAKQDVVVDFDRVNLYLYENWQISPWLSLIGGVAYDRMNYPENFRSVPINDRQQSIEKVSPKAGLIVTPWRGGVIRGGYTKSLSGTSFDESIRLEPTQVAGFLQSYRTLISEDLIGGVAGSEYEFFGVSAEQKFPVTRTYLGVEYNVLKQDLNRTTGVFDSLMSGESFPSGVVPSSLAESDHYREDSITATVNQLIGSRWAFGARYQVTRSRFDVVRPELDAAFSETSEPTLAGNIRSQRESHLHTLGLFAIYNHESGFFARAEANWYSQANDSLRLELTQDQSFQLRNIGQAGDNFWQLNVYAGWRFFRNQCEVGVGILNLGDVDYRLDPLTPYAELPRERTIVLRARFAF